MRFRLKGLGLRAPKPRILGLYLPTSFAWFYLLLEGRFTARL